MSNALIEKRYQTKIIITPQVIQYYVYSKSMRYDFETIRKDYDKSLEGEKSIKSLYRSRNNLLLTISSNVNYYSKFITLTMAKTTLSRDEFLKYFKHFTKNFHRQFKQKLKYVGVLERQKKRGLKENNEGSWHIHLIVFNSQKLHFPTLKQCWAQYGSVDIKKCRHVSELGVYMLKYLTKENVELNKKAILTSQGLELPSISRDIGQYVPNHFDFSKSYSFYQGNVKEATTIEELESMEVHVWFYEIHLNRPKRKKEEIISLDPFSQALSEASPGHRVSV